MAFFGACKYEYIDITAKQENDSIIVDSSTLISYSNDILPIINSNCLSCHSGAQPPNLSTFDGVKANADAIKSSTSSRYMPRGSRLSDKEIILIALWVEQGANNN